MKYILTLIAALALSIAAFATPVTVSNDTQYASKFLDKGVISGPIFTNVTVAGYKSFNAGLTLYAPTYVWSDRIESSLSRVDVMGSYTFHPALGDLTIGDTQKHYTHPNKLTFTDRNQPFVKFQMKSIPASLVVRYDIHIRSLNFEGALKKSYTVAKFKVTPSVYAGYTDTSDKMPHFIKAIKVNNRYYGGGLNVSRHALGGDISVGGYVNRSDHAFEETNFFWTGGYSFRF